MKTLRTALVGCAALLLLAACNLGGGGGNTSGTVNTPGGSVGVALQGGSFLSGPSPANVNTPGYQTPYGAIAFTARVERPGDSLTVTLTFPGPIPQGAVLLKCTGQGCNTIQGAQFSGNTATFQVRDGGPLDADGQANGEVRDPVALGVPHIPEEPRGLPDENFGAGGKVDHSLPSGIRASLDVRLLGVQPDGKIVVADKEFVARFLPDGQLDPQFADGGFFQLTSPQGPNLNPEIRDGLLLQDGGILLVGFINTVHNSQCSPWLISKDVLLLRLDAQGREKDRKLLNFGRHEGDPLNPCDDQHSRESAYVIHPYGNGFLIGGDADFPPYPSTQRAGPFVARLRADLNFEELFFLDSLGSVHKYFATIYALATLPGGRILAGGIGGYLSSYTFLALLDDRGNWLRDSEAQGWRPWRDVGVYDDEMKNVSHLLPLPDGGVLVATDRYSAGGWTVRLRDDLRVDTSFSVIRRGDYGITGLALQSNGKLLVRARDVLLRYNEDGTQDIQFAPPSGKHFGLGSGKGMVLTSEGKVLVVGSILDGRKLRLSRLR